MKKKKGNILDFLTILLTILAMSVLVMVYVECSSLLMKKLEVGQLSRKYILKMETEGYLTSSGKADLVSQLQEIGLQDIDLTGTTLQPVVYGDSISLKIRGRVNGRIVGMLHEIWEDGFVSRQFNVEETRMSTAKN